MRKSNSQIANQIFCFQINNNMKKFLHADWLRACQLIPNSANTWRKTKLVQKVEIECKNLKLNWLTGKSRDGNSQMANQNFCFQIKRRPWMAQFMPQFFPDCVIRACFPSAQPSRNFFSNQHAWRNFFMYIIKR